MAHIVYKCEYCDMEFYERWEAVEHEVVWCEKNPKSDRSIRLNKKENNND